MTLDQGRPALDAVIAALHEMVQRMPSAGAAFHELEHHCGGVTLNPNLTLTLPLTLGVTNMMIDLFNWAALMIIIASGFGLVRVRVS